MVEPSLVARGIHVFSNASAFRRIAGIPLVFLKFPEDMQSYYGHACAQFVSCACSHTNNRFEVTRSVSVTIHTRQALSGAGWRLLWWRCIGWKCQSNDSGEEETHCWVEVFAWNGDSVIASCNRVPETDGHFVSWCRGRKRNHWKGLNWWTSNFGSSSTRKSEPHYRRFTQPWRPPLGR